MGPLDRCRHAGAARRARVVSAVVVAVVLAAAVVGAGPARARAGRHLAVTGYAEDGTDPARVSASAAALTTLGVDGVVLAGGGASVTAPSSGSRALLHQAHREDLRAELLVSNYSDALDDFDPEAAHRLLGSPAHRRAVVAALAGDVRRQGWDGVQIDLEALTGQDREPLVAFTRQLRAALPRGTALSMAITASTDDTAFRDGGYDLTPLGRVLDRVVLMAYDQHGPTWNGAGPIGGLPWQSAALRVVRSRVPATKIDLGVAGYGCTWPASGTGVQVSDARARALVATDRASARWDAVQGEWTATLHDGTVLWWSDARSWSLRRAVARREHLHGMALWALGTADRLPGARR